MIRHATSVGFVSGLIISIAGIYPLVGLFAPLFLPGYTQPVANDLLHGLLLMASAVVGVPAFLLGGAAAARRARARGWLHGARAGMLAAAVAGMGGYITLVSPLNALAAYGRITPHLPELLAAQPLPPDALLAYVADFDNLAFSLELTLAATVLTWGLAGALMGWRQRDWPVPARPTLYGLAAQGAHPRRWFDGDETAMRVGLRVGTAVGVLALVTTFGWFYAGFAQDLPQFQAVMETSRTGMVTGPLRDALAVLSPLLALALILFGPAIVALIKNPPNRFAARAQAVIFAAVIIATFLYAVGLRIFYFNVGLAPFFVSQAVQQDPDGTAALMQRLETVLSSFETPSVLTAAALLFSWLTVGLAVLTGFVVGGVHALVSVLLVPPALPRPVDRASRLVRELQRAPGETLPALYRVCEDPEEAFDVLAHVAICAHRRMPAVARLAAAYHTLGSSRATADHAQTVAAIQAILRDHPEWRWAGEFGAYYRVLHDVLAARTLEDILAIQPPPGQQTGSLPALVAQSVQHIGRILGELHKLRKVDDLPTQLIFLENSLEAIHTAQGFLAAQAHAAVALPQRVALGDALAHWQTIVLAAIKRLKGRADLTAALQSRQCVHCTPLPLVWSVQNKGLNVAQAVRLRLLPGDGYAVDSGETEIEILPVGETRQVTLTVLPRADARRLRVAWELHYDDAVDNDRRLTFADVVDFDAPQRPFQRIFPIPYVTGTPLKSDDVFVGRADVFAFIRENLLGAHQNNVIILHGQRRTGKTSVLYRLRTTMADTHIAVLIDMQGKPARNEADFLYAIADDIVFALEEAGIAVEMPPREAFDAAPEFYFRARFLRSLYPRLGDRRLLLLFDEFEELQRRVENGRLQPEIFQFLRNLMQHEDPLDFVFSGTHRLEDLSADYWSVLFNIAVYKPITFLSPAEVRRLMTDPVADYNVEYDPLAAERIIQVAAGHPYFTQLILHEMLVHYNATQRSYLTAADVAQVLERIVERGEAHFKYIWAESTLAERELLQATAELLHAAEVVNVNEVRGLLGKYGRSSDDNWEAALAALVGRDILTRRSPQSLLYRFKIDLIRLWIERTRPSL